MANIEKRISSKGEISYRAKVRLKGCPPQSATFDSITKAKKWAKRVETEISDGKYLGKIEAGKHTITETIDRYLKRNLPLLKPDTAYVWGLQLDWWKKQIGDYTLADLTPALLVETRDKLDERTVKGRIISSATKNRYMTAFQTVISTAYKEWGWLENNPFSRIKKLPEPKGRVRYLSDDERERLLTACKGKDIATPYLYPAVVIAMSTGARKNEILTLSWENVDLLNRRAILKDTKNGENRSIPLVEAAHKVMQGLYDTRKSDVWVFPSTDGKGTFDITKGWLRAIKNAKIKDFRFHDLRHTCASYLAMNGASLGEIAEVLGHKTLQMTKRYTHLSDAHIQNIVSKMNKKVFGSGE